MVVQVEEDLLKYLKFQYWGYFAAEGDRAARHNLPFEPMSMKKFLELKGVEDPDEEDNDGNERA